MSEIEETCQIFVATANDEFPDSMEYGGVKDGQIILRIKGKGNIKVDPETGEVDTKLIMPLVEKLKIALGQNVPAVPGQNGGSVPSPLLRSSAARELKSIHDQRATSFDVGKGKRAPTAAMISRAGNAAGFSYELLGYIHRPDYIEVKVACIAPDGRRNEAVVSVYRGDYLAAHAWELVTNNCPTAVTGADPETFFPTLAPGSKVTLVKWRNGEKYEESHDAHIWLFQRLASAWLFAGRSMETKAKSRAADQLLNTDATPQRIQSPEEEAEEQREADMVGA